MFMVKMPNRMSQDPGMPTIPGKPRSACCCLHWFWLAILLVGIFNQAIMNNLIGYAVPPGF